MRWALETYFIKAQIPAQLTNLPHDSPLCNPRLGLDQARRLKRTLMEPSRRAPKVRKVNMLFLPLPPRRTGPHCSIVHALSAVPPRPQSMILERNDRSKIPDVGVSRARTQSVDCAWMAMRETKRKMKVTTRYNRNARARGAHFRGRFERGTDDPGVYGIVVLGACL